MARAKQTTPQPLQAPLENATAAIVKWGLFLVLLAISPAGRETFRVPKDLLLRAEGILLISLALVGLVAGAFSIRRVPVRSPAVILAALAVGWAVVTSVLSTNRPLSALSLLTIVPATAVFLATFLIARRRGVELLAPLLWAGVVNSLLYLGQLFGIVTPFKLTEAFTGHNAATGFLGNANDLGSTLLPIAIAVTALALTDRENVVRNRLAAALMVVTVLISVSIAAIGALVVALVVMTLLIDWRKSAIAITALAIVGTIAVTTYEPFRYRVRDIGTAARTSSFDRLLSGRLASFTSAARMLRDRPLTGMGPGTFGWNYFPYKIEVTEARPDRFRDSAPSRFNFDEVHNDHLEILAETGVPGYLILLAALAWLATGSLRTRDTDEPEASTVSSWSRLTSLPLASGFAVIALAQYPLQLASSISATLFVMALCAAWRPRTKAEAPVSDEKVAPLSPRIGTRPMLAVAVALAAIPVWTLVIVPWKCNITTKAMEAAMEAALQGNPGARAFLSANLEAAERCRKHVRHDQSLNVAVAATYAMLDRSSEALAVYEAALRYDRRPEIYFNIGGIYLRSGYAEEAFENFLSAARFNPALAHKISGEGMKTRVLTELERREARAVRP